MQDFSPHLMILLLEREHPEIATSIKEKIKRTLPEKTLTDLTKISEIIDAFVKIKGKPDRWINGWTRTEEKTGKKKGNINPVDYRELLLAVILLFYDPEVVMGLKRSNRAMTGLLIGSSKGIGCSRNTVYQSVQRAITSFKIYRSFKEEVYSLYDQIQREKQLFN